MQTKCYCTKNNRLSGTRYTDIYDATFSLYRKIKRRTKRRPYIRSTYFNKEKIFLELFWRHLDQKNWRDRARRMRFFPSAVELIQYTHFDPESKDNPNDASEILHRFYGKTHDGFYFVVQLKEEKRNGQKWLLSVFPSNE